MAPHDHNHAHHHANMAQDMARRLAVVVILTIPLLFIAPIMGLGPVLRLDALTANGLALALGTAIFLCGGWPFFRGAARESRARRPAMMTLISLGVTVAYIYSAWTAVAKITKSGGGMDFWFELATLVAIMLAGHVVEMRATMRAGDALKSIAELLPKKAHRLRSGAKFSSETDDVELAEIQPGDILFVRENEKIPADGVVVSDSRSKNYVATVNESAITGESRAVKKYAAADDDGENFPLNTQVFAGSLNQNLPFKMRVTGTGEKSYLSQVAALVASAQNQKSRAENLADRVAGALFYFALVFAVASFAYWSLFSGAEMALAAVVATLVVACPHALGLAIPLVSARLMTIGAKNGLLIQNKTALESAQKIRFALLDKTGTLTDGNFTVRAVEMFSRKKVLPIFASLENGSTHPIALAIRDFYAQSFVTKNDKNPRKLLVADQKKYTAKDVENLPGVGVSGVISREKYLVVSPKFLAENGIELAKKHDKIAQKYLADGLTLAFLLREKSAARAKKSAEKSSKKSAENQKFAVLGVAALGDETKPGAKKFIASLRKSGIEPVMLTGDNRASAEKIAKKLGLGEFRAEVKPDEKAAAVREFQRRGKVLFVGDGVNDSPALAAADLSCAIGAGTSVAIAAADVVLTDSDPADVMKLLELARRSNRKIRENLWWGAGYNLFAVPAAAFGLLSPLVAGVLMSASTVIVAANAASLRDEKLARK